MNVEEVINEIKRISSNIENSTVFFEMRRWGVKYIVPETVEMMKVILTLDYLGLPITTNIVSNIMDKEYNTTISSLHRLGDKDVISLDNEGKHLTWKVNNEFKKNLDGKIRY